MTGELTIGDVAGGNIVKLKQGIFITLPQPEDSERRLQEKESHLKAILIDHSGFIRNRLNNFVGRVQELTEIRQRITSMQSSGGYITITGQAGQGKSSIIAKLVEEYGTDKIAHHFIPFSPGPDYQVSLLRDLMARLIFKYDLSDLYVASESRTALRDYFPKVLRELVAKGGQEVIFLDGLDQLMEDQLGGRDLSFLPVSPPEGVVLVLGTRPNDTLRPLELRKPHDKYDLPNLNRQDFDLILQHRRVKLDEAQADQFYKVMQENALYLDLAAKELAGEGAAKPEAIIKRVTDNPENIFSLSMERLQRKPNDGEWHTILKPILGILLVALEPLSVRHIRQVFHVRLLSGIDDQRLRKGLEQLGGLVADDGRQRYSLFHPKLYDYLRQDGNHPHKEYIFATDEEEEWHKFLADWCAQGDLSIIWEDVKHDQVEQGRRAYARQHYITHLYHAKQWQHLLDVLDTGHYGQAKIRQDQSMRSYTQDLDLGRQAAGWKGWTKEEGLAFLPHLWRYTLLRGSLTSQADRYPLAAFQLLLLLRREREALGLAELLTKSNYKTQVLLQIAKFMSLQPHREKDYLQILFRAQEEELTIENSIQRAKTLLDLGAALTQAQQLIHAEAIWTEAEVATYQIEESVIRISSQRELWAALVQAQQWHRAEAMTRTIKKSFEKVHSLSELGVALAQKQQWQYARKLWTEAETLAHTIKQSHEKAWALSKLAACRRERNSSRASRSASARVVQSTGKSARRERGRRQNRDRDGGPMTWKDATTLALRPE